MMMSTPSIWSAFSSVLLLLIMVNKSVAQTQKSRTHFWDIPVKKAYPPPPTGSIWDIPVPKPAPIVPPQSTASWENPDYFPPMVSNDSSPPCSCTFEQNNGDDDNCVVYGMSLGSLVAWHRASNICIEELGLLTRAKAHAEVDLLCPAKMNDENMDVLKFVELIQGYPSSSMAVRVKQLFLDTGVFVERENGEIDMLDKVEMYQGPEMDCSVSPTFCWKEVEATFERNKHVLYDLCVQLQEEKVADLQLEQQNIRIELCSRGGESESLPMACRALWQQIQDEKANFSNAACSSFGEGPGDAELPTCSNSTATNEKDIDNNTNWASTLSQLNHTDPVEGSYNLPDSNTTVEEFVDGELCPCTLYGGDDEEQCRVYGLSANGEKNDTTAWHRASYNCLKELDTISRSVNPTLLRNLCPVGANTADPFDFVEFIRKHQSSKLAYRISQLFLDKGLFVEKDNGEIVLSDTISLSSGHILDCTVAHMSCWNEIEYEFRQNSNRLQDFCVETLEEEITHLQKEQQEARVLLCKIDTPAPQECKSLWEQVVEEKANYPAASCSAFGEGPGDAQLPICEAKNIESSPSHFNSSDPSMLANGTSVPSTSAPSVGECACSFEQDDEASCMVYGSSVSGAKNELYKWHQASDDCLEELMRSEINLLCPNGTANATEFVDLVFMETPNLLSERTKQKFLDTSFFVEMDNGTVAMTDTITNKNGVTQNCTVTPLFCWHKTKFEFEEKIARLEDLCSELLTSQPTIDLKAGQEWARVVLCESNNNTVPEQCRTLGDQIKEEQKLYPDALCSSFGEGPWDTTSLPVCNVTDQSGETLPPTSETNVPENFTAVRFTGISMVLDGVGGLETSAREQWVMTTIKFYESIHNKESAQVGRKLTTVGIREFSTLITYQNESVTGSSTTIVYNTQVKYVRTSPDAPTSWELIKNPLKDEALNERYTEALRTSHSAFVNLESVGVPYISPPSAANSNDGNDGSDDEDGVKAVVIIGFVVLALCALTVCYAAYRHLRSRKGSSAGKDNRAAMPEEGKGGNLQDERSTASSKGAISSHAKEDDRYSSTSEILDSILREKFTSLDCPHTPSVATSMSEDTEGVDLECQMYAMSTITFSKTPDNVPIDEQSSLPSVIRTGVKMESPRQKSTTGRKLKKHDGVLKIDCSDYDHIFGDDQIDDVYLSLSLRNSIVGDATKSTLSTKNDIDDPVEEVGGDGYEGDVENPSFDNLIPTNGSASSINSSDKSNGSSEEDDCNDVHHQQSILPVSPKRTFVSINHSRTSDTDSRTDGEKESVSHCPSVASSGTYYDDNDNIIVVVEDARIQQQVIPQREETSCLGLREEDTTSSDSSDNHNNWPVDEEVIDVEAPPGWLGVVIDTSDPTGPPIVYDIKDASPMKDLLKVGDKIIAVDDEDVTHTSAPEVSRIINKRAMNPIRQLRILREFVLADEIETQRRGGLR